MEEKARCNTCELRESGCGPRETGHWLTVPWLSVPKPHPSPLRPTALSVRSPGGDLTFSPSTACHPNPTVGPR